jgi:hypothetical protein
LVALALVVMAFLRKSAVEERFMMAQFPATYPRYRADVPALLPHPVWRRRGAADPTVQLQATHRDASRPHD